RLETRRLVFTAESPELGLVLRFVPEALKDADYLAFAGLLALDPKARVFQLTKDLGAPHDRAISLWTRSFLGIMYFLSQSVEVPTADQSAGKITITRDSSSRPFDWSAVTDGLMRIRSSQKRPESAAISVRYRGSWFYIDDADLDSKSTFSLLGQVFALQSGVPTGQAPILTLPVGG
ncbi:MAG: hypothetical protein AAGG11_20790, partial [Pseudomonadota bacterium]